MRSGKGLIGLMAMGFACVATMSLCGCGSKGEAPYRLAVTSLEQHGAKIRDAFTAGKPDDAHDSLHEVGNILDRFPKLIDSTRLSEEDRQAAKQAADELFDAYTELDMSLHDGEKVQYDEVSEKIATNLAVLKAKIGAAGSTGTSIGEANHDDHDGHDDHAHDGHDHGDHEHGDHDDHAHDTDEAHDQEHGDGEVHDHEQDDHAHDENHEQATGSPVHAETK